MNLSKLDIAKIQLYLEISKIEVSNLEDNEVELLHSLNKDKTICYILQCAITPEKETKH